MMNLNDINKAFGSLVACLWLKGIITKENLKEIIGVKTDEELEQILKGMAGK